VLAIPIRAVYGLEDFITERHLGNMAKILLATGLMVGYGYLMEVFMAWYSGNEFERYVTLNRMLGPYGWMYWLLLVCNVAVPQLFWFRQMRTSPVALWIVALIVLLGMWLERYMIIITALHRDYLPSSWGMYSGTAWDWATFLGTLGLFTFLLFLFLRFLPMISIFEMRAQLPEADVAEDPPAPVEK
jgi:molybdopterin-containing oxidoreductase family membrane subunit